MSDLKLRFSVEVEDSTLNLAFSLTGDDPEGAARNLLMAAVNELEVVVKRFQRDLTPRPSGVVPVSRESDD